MHPAPSAAVIGSNGLRGRILTTSCPSPDTPSWVTVMLDDGRTFEVPEKQLILQHDKTWLLPTSDTEPKHAGRPNGDAAGKSNNAADELRVPVIAERMRVDKAEATNVIRLQKAVHEQDEVADLPLVYETASIQRVPVNRVVDAAPAVRQEGDVTIIPVLEETLVVEKRLVLREEIHIRRERREVHEPQRVTLRQEVVTIDRSATPVDVKKTS